MQIEERNNEHNQIRENPNYNDYAFPISMHTITKTDIFPKGRGFHDLHWHDEIQFTYVTKGTLTISIEGSTCRLDEGEAVFINGGILHMTTDMSDDGEYVGFMFPEKVLGFFPGSRMEQNDVIPYINNYALSSFHLRRSVDWHRDILEDIEKLKNIFLDNGRFAYEYEISVMLVSIWLKMLKGFSGKLRKPSNTYIRRQERVRSMIKFIVNNYSEPITLKEIADSANISVEECRRCFKDIIRDTPVRYLISYRVTASMELLRNTDLMVTDIAYRVGFNDTSYFVQAFKKKTGMTPRDYRDSIF